MLNATEGLDPNIVPAGERFTLKQLEDAFNLVCNPNDWRDTINKTILVDDEETIERITDAVIFYTSTAATVRRIKDIRNPKKIRVNVKATGYRMGPAGP